MSKSKPEPTVLASIESLANAHARDREALAGAVTMLEELLTELRRRKMPAIRRLVIQAKASHLELYQAIDANRAAFEKPRSRILHGIRCGLKKGKGKVTFANADKVVALIEKHLADQAELLIVTKKNPVKAALANLAVADLKRIGCEISGTGDVVLIEPVDSAVDKLVQALLADEPEETQE